MGGCIKNVPIPRVLEPQDDRPVLIAPPEHPHPAQRGHDIRHFQVGLGDVEMVPPAVPAAAAHESTGACCLGLGGWVGGWVVVSVAGKGERLTLRGGGGGGTDAA